MDRFNDEHVPLWRRPGRKLSEDEIADYKEQEIERKIEKLEEEEND